jgi:hypothetical protein
VGLGTVGRFKAWCGMAGAAWRAGIGGAGHGMAWQVRFVLARTGRAGCGVVGHGRRGVGGKAGTGSQWIGMAGAERSGRAGCGGARHGRHGFCFEQCLRRKKWKLKMYVGVIVFPAMGLIQ